MSTTTKTPTKLDLGCGQNKKEGFFGIDIVEGPDVDFVCNLFEDPWPFEDNTVEEAFSSHVVEHAYPVGGPHDGLIHFMGELWRVCKPDAKVELIHPYGMSERALQDPTHCRYLVANTWPYFNLEARRQMQIDHYPIAANFQVENVANGFYPEWAVRSDISRAWGAAHYWNVVTDLVVTLRAIKEE